MTDDDAVMRSQPHERCFVCSGPGEWLYQGLPDRLFGAAGSWGLRHCADRGCGLIWIDPMPLAADLGKAYERYYTHNDMPAPDSWLRNAFVAAKRAYLAAKYGYPMPAGQWWAAALPIVTWLPLEAIYAVVFAVGLLAPIVVRPVSTRSARAEA